jgi:thiol-disulfide isomerase/thioredoxin
VRFVVENYGHSKLAERFGVTRYPAIFVDDVLVATPKDFGFYGAGEGEKTGRYAPLKSAASHDRFRADLARMVRLILSGREKDARKLAASAAPPELRPLPAFLSGLDGRVVLVEFWATWCPPCRGTLTWLGQLKKRYGDRIEIVAIAVESDEANVARYRADLSPQLRWMMGTPDMARAFGDISAVPTLFLFDRAGKPAGVFYGAPPTLHKEVEGRIQRLESHAQLSR